MRIDLPSPDQFSSIFYSVTGVELSNPVTGIATDSRHVIPGDMFIALKGERVDGHIYLDSISRSGASAVLVENDFTSTRTQSVKVENPLITIGLVAQKWRQQFSIPVVGITGTNGKTSTKDLLVHILEKQVVVHYTQGNFNTSIGLPLSLFTLMETHEISVLEMGASQPGDISYLCNLAEPTHGLITNIAPAHLEGFGSIDEVAREKGQLFNSLEKGTAFVNTADPRVVSLSISSDAIRFGYTPDCDYFASIATGDDGTITLHINDHVVPTNSQNPSFAKNVFSTSVIAHTLGVSWENIIQSVSDYSPTQGRCVVSKHNGWTIIDDTYNANLESTKAAVDFLSAYPGGKKIFVFGDMLELGEKSSNHHSQVGEYCNEKNIDLVFTIGTETVFTHNTIRNGVEKHHMDNKADLVSAIVDTLHDGDVILFKGSRGMAMESLIQDLEDK